MTEKHKKNDNVRVRFAPSPTGPFHIGNLRSALFNYLFAKKYQGKLILRIEDTDKERSEKRWEQGILQALSWVGIAIDEGPYWQSQRLGIYKEYLEKLLNDQDAYYCFCAKDELEAHRQYLLSSGKLPIYSGKCRNLDKETIAGNLKQNKPFVIRFKTPNKKVVFDDLVLGRIEQDSSLLGDFVIAKSLLEPLYNFACVVDDYEMQITDVIRGGDHLANTPKQILLAQALGIKSPRFLHLPLVLGKDKAKLSKRHGATFIPEYEEQGYLSEAMVNFLAFLGWNPGTSKEIYSLSELERDFSFEKIQKSPAIFNQEKLDWLNGYYIRKKSLKDLTKLCLPYLEKAGLIDTTKKTPPIEFIEEAVGLYQERLKKLSEIGDLTGYLFKEKIDFPSELLLWKNQNIKETKKILKKTYKKLKKIKDNNWNKDFLTKELMDFSLKIGGGDRGAVLWPLRAALSGKKASAGPFEILTLLGKNNSLQRISDTLNRIP